MSNPILRQLHSVIDRGDPEWQKITEAIYERFRALAQKRKDIDMLRFLNSAEGEFLDEWGDVFEDARLPGESDSDYFERIAEHFRGRGVTRPSVKQAVNRILSPQECVIIKWFEPAAKNMLEIGYFELQLPLRDVDGFVLEQSYLEQDTYLMSFDDIKILWDLKRIKALIDKLKPGESEYKLTTGGEIL